jgi:ketosteroid isomerase-like protein
MTGPSLDERIRDHFTAIGQDEERAAAIYADDAVLEYVQSGERIAGKANISASRQAYPGRPSSFEVVRVIGAGDVWVAELVLRIDGADPHPVAAIVELRDGLIVRERIYIAEPWDPPAYRAQWAETIESLG